MKSQQYLALVASLAANVVHGQNSSDFTAQCTSLADTLASGIPNATVQSTVPVTAGTNLTITADPTCQRSSQVVDSDVCRVSLFVPTSDRSNLTMEVWLPPAEAWTGRFLSTGNGGLGGCIQYEDLAYTTALGFAAVGTNNGHDGNKGDAFYQNEEVVLDFAYRAMHTGIVLGKQVSETFYGKPHDKSYYLGCSTGGRQGFKEAQAYPDDFDGLVIGAPALAFNNLSSWSGSFYVKTGSANASTFVPTNLWTVIHEDILNQCDGIDGYVDGIIEDPSLCNYRPEALICAAGNTTNCLTGEQANTVREIFTPIYGLDGQITYPAMQPGSEDLASRLYYGGQPFQYTTGWFANAIYNDKNWDPATLGPKDYAAAHALNIGNIETWDGDLSAVRDRGSKILHYHGQADAIISSLNSPRYYDHVSRTMGSPSSVLDDFYRFFRISGMGHCSGGNGASFIGQEAASNATLDPEGNVLMAMVRWVEEGTAPDSILGTAYVNETKDSGEIAFQRRHCKYPLRNVYSGSGDATLPDSWECVV
ncbi:Feruloyl esterase [Diaporthe australafricana]|uniref:Carboxylic ester hydrolase n=1 Tax=Diaporthe australafricana TaxID=127596 RepID=A0ABR3XBU6_9PEZI